MMSVEGEQISNETNNAVVDADGDETMQMKTKEEEEEDAPLEQKQEEGDTMIIGDQSSSLNTTNNNTHTTTETKSEEEEEDSLLPSSSSSASSLSQQFFDSSSEHHVLATLTIVHEYTVPVPETVHGASRHFTQKNKMVTIGRGNAGDSNEMDRNGKLETTTTTTGDSSTSIHIHPSQFLGVDIIPPRDVQQLDMPKKRGRKKKVIPQVAVPHQTAISKHHCSVMYDQMKQTFIILNHGRNGTWVNNLLLTNGSDGAPSVAELRDGDVIRLVDQTSPTYVLFEIVDEDLKKRFVA